MGASTSFFFCSNDLELDGEPNERHAEKTEQRNNIFNSSKTLVSQIISCLVLLFQVKKITFASRELGSRKRKRDQLSFKLKIFSVFTENENEGSNTF